MIAEISDPENDLVVRLTHDGDGWPIVEVIPSDSNCMSVQSDGSIYHNVEVRMAGRVLHPMFSDAD